MVLGEAGVNLENRWKGLVGSWRGAGATPPEMGCQTIAVSDSNGRQSGFPNSSPATYWA